MDLEFANTPTATECPSCETVTTKHYLLTVSGREDVEVCEACVDRELNARNDGLYGLSEWYSDDRELSKQELVQVVETEYIRGANIIRISYSHEDRLVREYDHREKLEALVDAGRLSTGTIGVDDARAVRPTAERREELITTYEAFQTWDLSHSRIQTIKEELEEELGRPINP